MSEFNENMVPENNNNEAMESNDSGSSGGVGSAISGLVGLGTGLFGGLKIGKSREKARILDQIHEVVDDESFKKIEKVVNAKPEKKKKEKKKKGKLHLLPYREPVIDDDSGAKPDAANGESQKEEEPSGEATE